MDPISFAASLATLIGVVATTSKAIHDVHKRFRDAPEDVKRLLEQLQTFQSLLKELEVQLQEHQNNTLLQETLRQLWRSFLTQMKEDIRSLGSVVSQLGQIQQKKSLSAKTFLSIRQKLSDKEIAKYQGKIETHCTILTNIQAMVCSRKLDDVLQHITRVGDESKASIQGVSSQLTSVESLGETRHQAVLDRLKNHIQNGDLSLQRLDELSQQQVRAIDISEASFQAVHSGLVKAISSNRKGHAATHTMLNQIRCQLQPILRSCITFGLTAETARPLIDSRRASSITTTRGTTVFWESYHYRFPIGRLKLNLRHMQKSTYSERSTSEDFTESKVEVIFTPPWWLSSFAIKYAIMLNYSQIDDQWRSSMNLKPLIINHSSVFINAVWNCDVEGVKQSFRTGLARPTDYVLDEYGGGVVPWTKRIGWSLPPVKLLPLACNLSDFMVEAEIPAHEDLISLVAESSFNRSNEGFKSLLFNFLEHGGTLLAGKGPLIRDSDTGRECFLNTFINMDWIPDLLFRSSEVWLVSDLSSLENCLIGTLAIVDTKFQKHLKKHLMKLQSPFFSNGTSNINSMIRLLSDTASIMSHFHKLQASERELFLINLCRRGSASMLKLFMDAGIDVDQENCSSTSLLGHAAIAGNTDVIHLLLDVGANAALASAEYISWNSAFFNEICEQELWLLIEHVQPARLTEYWDPLGELIRYIGFTRNPTPELLETMLARKLYFPRKLVKEACYRCSVEKSYLFNAIIYGLPHVVDLLLQHGAQANMQITDMFDFNVVYKEYKMCTWFTFSVMLGHASCTDVLIQHGATVTDVDGSGRSAIQLAQLNTRALHPRYFSGYAYTYFGSEIDLEEDMETLAVVERALASQVQHSKNLQHFRDIRSELEICYVHPKRQEIVMLVLREMTQSGLGYILTPPQIAIVQDYIEDLFRNSRALWHSAFYEALLVRSFYILSYLILLALEVRAIITRRKRFLLPSRSLLSTGAVLGLVLTVGASLFGSSLPTDEN